MRNAPRAREPGPEGESTGDTDLDALFAALSNPIRRGIVDQLTHGPRSVTQLGAPFAVSAPAISKHLAVLERCGLIARWTVGRVHYCRLVGDPLLRAKTWLDQHQAFWERQLDALSDYLDREEDTCGQPPPTRRR